MKKKEEKKCLVVACRCRHHEHKDNGKSSTCELTTRIYGNIIDKMGVCVLHTLWALRYWPSMASVTSVKVSACRSWSKTVNKLDWWLFHRRQKRCEAIFADAGVCVVSYALNFQFDLFPFDYFDFFQLISSFLSHC